LRRRLQVAKGVLLLIVAAVFAVVSIESLSKLWVSYQDSPWWIYVGYGTLAALAAIVCLGIGMRSLRRH
jgi:membrane protein YdbS with pleckstrin-like domain